VDHENSQCVNVKRGLFAEDGFGRHHEAVFDGVFVDQAERHEFDRHVVLVQDVNEAVWLLGLGDQYSIGTELRAFIDADIRVFCFNYNILRRNKLAFVSEFCQKIIWAEIIDAQLVGIKVTRDADYLSHAAACF